MLVLNSLDYILSRTDLQLLRSIACYEGVRLPLVNALVYGNLCEYRHKSYIAKKLDSVFSIDLAKFVIVILIKL